MTTKTNENQTPETKVDVIPKAFLKGLTTEVNKKATEMNQAWLQADMEAGGRAKAEQTGSAGRRCRLSVRSWDSPIPPWVTVTRRRLPGC